MATQNSRRDMAATKVKKRTGKPPKGYDSWLEYDLHIGKLKGCAFHPQAISYVQEKTYYPDFTLTAGGVILYIEAKGRFRDRAEARKYVDVRKGLQGKEELVFVFQKPGVAMPGAQRRKDGTRQTHAEWAILNGFRFFSPDNVQALTRGIT